MGDLSKPDPLLVLVGIALTAARAWGHDPDDGLLTLLFVDFFDNMGTLLAVCRRALVAYVLAALFLMHCFFRQA